MGYEGEYKGELGRSKAVQWRDCGVVVSVPSEKPLQ